MARRGVAFCTRCLQQGEYIEKIPGSMGITFLLTVFVFIVGGIIYSVWRHSNVYKVCPFCESQELVGVESERAKQLLTQRTETQVAQQPAARPE